MKGKNVITINGRLYDAVTGMPVAQTSTSASGRPSVQTPNPHLAPKPKPLPNTHVHGGTHRAFSDIGPAPKATPFASAVAKPQVAQPATQRMAAAHAIHQKPQKSQTLYRAALQKPEPAKAQKPTKPVHHRSPVISRYGPGFDQSTTAQAQPAETAQAVEAPTVHPAVAKALANLQQKRAQTPAAAQIRQESQAAPQARSSKELKEALIKERLAEVETVNQQQKKSRRGLFKRQPKLTTILSTSLAVLLLGGYLTFINLPNISMRVAATRAGIAASFPSYKPDGYSFQGPITYAPGEVSINFKSNTNSSTFTLKQKTSNWDSQAVLDNYVTKQTENYLTYQEQGLTIYSFDNKAAWVNGGLLYSLEGNAQLSSEQVLRLATSL